MKQQKSEFLTSILLFTGLSSLIWAKAALGGKALFSDLLFRVFYPYAVFIRNTIRSGDFPLWNPHLYSGVPFLANMETALFYPFTYLYVIFDFPAAALINITIHTVMAAVFMYQLAREWRLSNKSAWLAGLCFAANGYFIVHYTALPQFDSYVWLPLIFRFFKRILNNESPLRDFSIAALALSFQIFAGHPQFAGYTIMILLISITTGDISGNRLKALMWLLLLLAVAALITSVQLIPFWQFASETSRVAETSYENAVLYSLAPWELAKMLLFPLWNRFWTPSSGDPHILSFYVGWPLLALAITAVGQKPLRNCLSFAVIACTGILLALGKYLPFYRFLYSVCPFFRYFRFPAQALYLACFGLSLLAGQGMERLSSRKWLSNGLFLAALADLWFFSQAGIHAIDKSLYKVETPAIRFLHAHAELYRITMTPRTRTIQSRRGDSELQAGLKFKDSIFPSLAMALRLYDVDGQEVLRYARYDKVLEELAKNPHSPWMDKLGIRYVLSFWDLPGNKFKNVFRSSVNIFENPMAYPKAYFITSLLATDPWRSNEAKRHPVEVVDYRPNKVLLWLNSDQAGWVVLTDTYDKGWTATLNGREITLWRVNEVQRAVRVGSGPSLIKFQYWPPYLGTTAIISLLTLISIFFINHSQKQKRTDF